MNSLYKDMNIEGLQYVYDESERSYKGVYREQKSNLEELLSNIAKILLTYKIVDSILDLNGREKTELNSKLGVLAATFLNNEYKLEKDKMKSVLEHATDESYSIRRYIVSLGTDIKAKSMKKKNINDIVNKAVDGEIWSDRLWSNKKALEKDLKKQLKKFLDGKISVNDIETVIRDKYARNAYESNRLVLTEVARVQNEANDRLVEDLNIIKQMFTATLDSKTSKDCRDNDGRIFDVDDPNKPKIPLHPFCRSCYINMVENWDISREKRMDNESKTLINYTDYKNWKQNNN